MTTPKRKRRLFTSVLVIALIAPTAVLAFRLFEPVFVYRLDWAALPTGEYPQQSETINEAFAPQAEAAQRALANARAELDAPALSAAVAIDGQIVWRSAIGYSSVEARRPVDFDTRFRLGSTSKAVTSVAVGTLIDSGQINLDAPIQSYVPSFPEQRWPITLRQVMSHRAGVRDYGVCLCFPIWEHLNQRHFENIDAEVALVAHSPLLFEPGTSFAYTSLGYNLAGGAIEGASGQSFGVYLQRAVFAPLGMTQTGLDAVPGADAGIATFYEVENDAYKRAYPVDNSIRWPSGGILSTPSDMVRLGSAMLDDRLLSAATRATLVTVPEGGAEARGGSIYALGWRTGEWTLHNGSLSTLSYHHGGTAVGASSVFVVFPEYRMVVSLMMNKGGTSVDGLALATDSVAEAFIPASRQSVAR